MLRYTVDSSWAQGRRATW